MYIANKALLLAQALIDIAVAGPLHTPKIALYTNNFFPARGSLFADFTIGDFGGLTNVQAVTWGTPWINGFQQAEVLGAVLNWLTTADTLLPITAYGWVLLDTAGTAWLDAERFAEPYVFSYNGQNFSMVPRQKWN